MRKFKGFTAQVTFTRIPDEFFHQLLGDMDDLDELKVTLQALWKIDHMEGNIHGLREADFNELVPDARSALEKAVSRGSLLRVEKAGDLHYFVNTPRGRAAAEALAGGELDKGRLAQAGPLPGRPNIYRLYEENIGPLTPILAEALKDAEQSFDAGWIEDAFEIAVKNNKRNWRYIEAILKRWKDEGRGKNKDRQDSKKDTDRYLKSEFAEYLEPD